LNQTPKLALVHDEGLQQKRLVARAFEGHIFFASVPIVSLPRNLLLISFFSSASTTKSWTDFYFIEQASSQVCVYFLRVELFIGWPWILF
jgi:hypothetical protein